MVMARWIWIAVVLSCGLPGCCNESKAGDACTQGKSVCADKTTELVCQDGKFVTSPCRGTKGCRLEEEKHLCDFSGNAEGDSCSLANEGAAQCSVNGRRMILCHTGKYELHSCRGPKGCDNSSGKIECDRSVQMESDPCVAENTYTCSMDNKRALLCKGGKYVVDEYCRGPKGCASTGDKAQCDRGPQNNAEPCHKNGDFECGLDGKTMLVCKNLRWEVEQKCPGKCVSAAGKTTCQEGAPTASSASPAAAASATPAASASAR
jgi:hypothetical protein